MGLVGMIDRRNHLRCPVGGCIVHDDQLGHERLSQHAIHGRDDGFVFVESWHYQ